MKVDGVKKSIFVCPKCGSQNAYVSDSRADDDNRVKLRSKCCRDCGNHWQTIELSRSEFSSLLRGSSSGKEEELSALISKLTTQAQVVVATVNSISRVSKTM